MITKYKCIERTDFHDGRGFLIASRHHGSMMMNDSLIKEFSRLTGYSIEQLSDDSCLRCDMAIIINEFSRAGRL